MNLVAKEYVAAQDPEDPGVLILSRFAGAAAELTAALLVNPYDPETVATSIAHALSMPLEERRYPAQDAVSFDFRERPQIMGRAFPCLIDQGGGSAPLARAPRAYSSTHLLTGVVGRHARP